MQIPPFNFFFFELKLSKKRYQNGLTKLKNCILFVLFLLEFVCFSHENTYPNLLSKRKKIDEIVKKEGSKVSKIFQVVLVVLGRILGVLKIIDTFL